MKKIVLITGLIVTISLSTYARKLVAEGNTYSALGKYKIEMDDNYVTLNGLQHKPYVISFENTKMQVRVAVTMKWGSRIYYVLSDDLSVQYVSNRNYFGVERLGSELEKDGYTTSDSKLNRTQYYRQKVITGGDEWRKDKTALIAAFFPMLLNNTEDALAMN
jgi:hypothetical protein